jgi:hypothetical protein
MSSGVDTVQWVRDELQRVLELQRSYSSTASAEMVERGEIIRNAIPASLLGYRDQLEGALGVNDFFSEGRDGTGRKTRVPWARWGSRARSPRATEGFYLVYLFAASGDVVYLSLNQGTTDFIGNDFVPKPPLVLAERVQWAREALVGWEPQFDEVRSIELGDPGLGAGYESGNIFAIAYEGGSIPDDSLLLADMRVLSEGLGRLYAAHDEAPIPHEQPELKEAEELAEQAVGGRKSGGRVGFRTNSQEIKVIEMHAVAAARGYYESHGWKVKEFGKPFDLKVSKPNRTLTVEVKGTTGDGAAVPLTAGEVAHHADAFPNNALVVVRGITLTRDETAPRASGGTLYELRGWEINPSSLRAISYGYEIPREMYEHAGVSAQPLTGGDGGVSSASCKL